MKQQKTKLAGWLRMALSFKILIIITLSVYFMTTERIAFSTTPSVASLTLPAIVAPSSTQKARINTAYGKLPLIFEANQGQTDPHVQFVSHGPGYTLYLTPDAAVFSLRTSALLEPNPLDVKLSTLQMHLIGANPQAAISGLNPLPTQVNDYRGSDPQQWHTGIPTYAKVQLQKVYPGIDLIYYGNQRQLEYDFIVAPGADPAHIRLALTELNEGIPVTVADNGDLVLKMALGEIRWHKPVIYQNIAGQRRLIDGGFKLVAKLPPAAGDPLDAAIEIGFTVEAYDKNQPLIIDPVLAYSTFLGGMGVDYATSIAVDNSGNAYVTGAVASTNFPSTIFTNGYDRSNLPSLKNKDVFVAKFNPNGTALLFSTLMSGALPEDKDDIGYGIAVNPFGTAVYIVGTTASKTFPILPVAGGYTQAISGSSDAFIAKFNTFNGALLYSSYLGGGKDEGGTGITVDAIGNIYVTGYTTSLFPTAFPVTGSNVYQPNLSGGIDAFVVKFDPAWIMQYSTYFGGSKDDKGTAIAVDTAGSIYITGSTASTNLNTPWAFGKTLGGSGDAFVAKFAPDSTNPLVYSTYLGGSGLDSGASIAVDSQSYVYVTGSTASSNFPVTPGVFGAQNGGGGDAFITKIHPTGDVLIYSSYLGGSSLDSGAGIALAVNSSTGEIYTYVTGATASANFPVTPGAFSKARGGAQDAFVAMINADFSKVLYATYLGGLNNSDSGAGIAIDLPGRIVNDGFDGANYMYGVYIAGSTASSDFPVTMGSYDTTINSSSSDAFITKLGTAPVDLRVKLVCPATGSSGISMSCTVEAYNDGTVLPPIPAPATTFTVTVPSTVSFGTYPTDCSVVMTTMTCSVGVLFPGVSPVTKLFTITPTLPGSITITAQVAAAINDENTINNSTRQTVSIDKQSYGLVVTSTGTGNVTSSPSGINCGGGGIICSANFTDDASVILTATPTYFIGWSGACSGTAPTCVLTINTAKSVAATFTTIATVGVFRAGSWFLDTDAKGLWDGCQQSGGLDLCLFDAFGTTGDLPASGNWGGGTKRSVGVLRPSTGEWFIDRNGNHQWDGCGTDGCYSGFGAPGDLPVAGDWSGTGFAKIGVFRNGAWSLDYNGNGKWDGCGIDLCLNFGLPGDLPVAGNWDGGLKTGIGVFRSGTWYLDYNGNGKWDGCQQDGGLDLCLFNSFGIQGDLPAAGDWNGDGKAKVGVFRNGTWYLDYNGNGKWDGCSIDRCYVGFGMAGDLPVAVQQ